MINIDLVLNVVVVHQVVSPMPWALALNPLSAKGLGSRVLVERVLGTTV